MKRQRTTHSDLAAIIEAHAVKLATVPAGYCVSDASTVRCLNDIARIVVEQDERIGVLTVALREIGGKAAAKYLQKQGLPA